MSDNKKNTNDLLTKLAEIYENHTILIWAAIIIIPIVIITIGCLVWPELVYDEFVWKYFWGPTIADADEKSYGEVNEGYNPVNTIVYGLILVLALFGIYKVILKYKHKVDHRFLLALIPFIILGGTSRVMEDAEIFRAPVVYLFIAPQIYILIGLGVLGLFLIMVHLNRYSQEKGIKNAFGGLLIIYIILNIIYIIVFQFWQSGFNYIPNPVVPALFSGLILGCHYYDTRRTDKLEINQMLFGVGLLFLLLTIFILVQWQTIPEWTEAYAKAHYGAEVTVKPLAFILILGLTIMCTLIVYDCAKYLQFKFTALKHYLVPLNVALFFGHFLDASATFIAIDYYDYFEKHVLPTFFIDITGTAAVMFVLKIVLIGAVIYVIDVQFREDLKGSPKLVGLVKICVLILGLAPGIRDAVRLAMGL